MAAKAKEKEQESNEETKGAGLSDEQIKELLKAIGIEDPAKAWDNLRKFMAEAVDVKIEEMTDEEMDHAMKVLHKSGKLDPLLYRAGLVPKPGFFGALGGHDVNHLRSKGFTNKMTGALGIASKLAVLVYGGWKLYEYITSRG